MGGECGSGGGEGRRRGEDEFRTCLLAGRAYLRGYFAHACCGGGCADEVAGGEGGVEGCGEEGGGGFEG